MSVRNIEQGYFILPNPSDPVEEVPLSFYGAASTTVIAKFASNNGTVKLLIPSFIMTADHTDSLHAAIPSKYIPSESSRLYQFFVLVFNNAIAKGMIQLDMQGSSISIYPGVTSESIFQVNSMCGLVDYTTLVWNLV